MDRSLAGGGGETEAAGEEQQPIHFTISDRLD